MAFVTIAIGPFDKEIPLAHYFGIFFPYFFKENGLGAEKQMAVAGSYAVCGVCLRAQWCAKRR